MWSFGDASRSHAPRSRRSGPGHLVREAAGGVRGLRHWSIRPGGGGPGERTHQFRQAAGQWARAAQLLRSREMDLNVRVRFANDAKTEAPIARFEASIIEVESPHNPTELEAGC